MSTPLDEYFDTFSPTSRDRLAVKRAQQQAEADAQGVSLADIEYRDREAAKRAEADALRQRDAVAASTLATAAAAIPPLDGYPPLARAGLRRELVRQEVQRQQREAAEWARAHPEAAQAAAAAAEAARTRGERWRQYVSAYPGARAFDGTPRVHDPSRVPEWFS
jgi:hypothetical protein